MPDTWLEIGGLLLLFIIAALGSSPVPMPLTVTVLWLGQFDFPWAVIMVATAGSAFGWHLMATPLKDWFEKRPALAASIPAAYQEFFLRKTGWWVFFFNAVPFPFEPMRFLAVMNGYCLRRLLIFQALGRVVRYSILVGLGAALAHHKIMLWGVMLGLLLLPLLIRWLLPLFRPPIPREFPSEGYSAEKSVPMI